MNPEEHTIVKENKDKCLVIELKLYEECCKSYHRVDDFRAKLLGFLPLVTGAGIFVSLSNKNGENLVPFLPQIGVFGFIVTFGLLVYELKGIQKCTQFIKRGKEIEEKKFKTKGQFVDLWDNAGNIINEPVASGLIYSIVLVAWMYIILHSSLCLSELSLYVSSGSVFFISFSFVYYYWKHISD